MARGARSVVGRGPPVQIINRERLSDMMRDGVQVVEVLPHETYEHLHIAGALNIPLKQLEAETVEQLDRDRPVVVYCSGYT